MGDRKLSDKALEEEIDVFDILIALAENWRLLFWGTLLALVLSSTALIFWPRTYESFAIVSAPRQISVQGVAQGVDVHQMAVLLESRDALVSIQKRLGRPEDPGALPQLQKDLRIEKDRSNAFVKIIARGRSPELAQKTAQAAVEELIARSRRSGLVGDRIKGVIKAELAGLARDEELELVLAKKIPTAKGADLHDLAGSYAEIARTSSERRLAILSLQSQLDGVAGANVLVQPFLPQKPVAPRPVLVLTVGSVGTLLLLIVFVFMRQGWRNAAKTASGSGKIARLRAVWSGGSSR